MGTYMHELTFQGLVDMAGFLRADGGAADGRHQPVAGWLWWALNPNSNDTGGLVRDVAPSRFLISASWRKSVQSLYLITISSLFVRTEDGLCHTCSLKMTGRRSSGTKLTTWRA
jgi:hypothetical protein